MLFSLEKSCVQLGTVLIDNVDLFIYFFIFFSGVVRERATWCYPVFHIFDSLGSAILKVKGPMFHFGLCGESVPFEVTSVENGNKQKM